MSTAGLTAPRSPAPGVAQRPGPNQSRTLHAELIKMRTLRSTGLTLLAAVVGLVGLGLLICLVTNNTFNQMPPDRIARFDPVARSLGGVNIAQLAVGVLGVLLVTGEYSTGMVARRSRPSRGGCPCSTPRPPCTPWSRRR